MEEDDGQPYVPAVKIRKQYTVSNNTLRGFANSKKVRVIRIGSSGKRLYSLPDIRRILQVPVAARTATAQTRQRAKVVYCRGSSQKQKEDLARQRKLLTDKYPSHEVIEDIASGVNFHRRGLVALLKRAIRGDIEEVVVAHRDRFCRIAYELVETVLRACRCRIVVFDEDVALGDGGSDERELQEYFMAIVSYIVASHNGKRAAMHRNLRAREAAERAARASPAESSDDEE